PGLPAGRPSRPASIRNTGAAGLMGPATAEGGGREAAIPRFSAGGSGSKISPTCGTYPTPRLASASGGRFVTSSSPSLTLPRVTRRIPTSALSSVLFPAPFGPITATISPAPAVNVTSRTTGAPPYPAVTPPAARNGAARGRPSAGEIGIDNFALPAQDRH